MTLDEEEAAVPFLDGWHAHRLGVDVDENPYDEQRQSKSHSLWTSGWCRRFGAIKHGDDTTERDEAA